MVKIRSSRILSPDHILLCSSKGWGHDISFPTHQGYGFKNFFFPSSVPNIESSYYTDLEPHPKNTNSSEAAVKYAEQTYFSHWFQAILTVFFFFFFGRSNISKLIKFGRSKPNQKAFANEKIMHKFHRKERWKTILYVVPEICRIWEPIICRFHWCFGCP